MGLKIQFLGAAQQVTGSKTRVTYRDRAYLVDCGLFQGERREREQNWADLPHAAGYAAVFLTHAHIDHCGYLPRLVKQGFHGPIYCTAATAALARVLLADAAHLQEEDAEDANTKHYSRHDPALPLFNLEDVERTLRLLHVVHRDEWIQLAPGLSYRFLRSGHLLGSSFVQFNFLSGEDSRVVTFSGDLGSERSHIIKGPVRVTETDYLIMEGTYGDRAHRPEGQEVALARAINTVHARRGVLLIPAFAVGRTQEILYLINKLEDDGVIPHVPLYLDSPMALKVTEIYRHGLDDLKPVVDRGRLVSSMDGSRFKATAAPAESRRLQGRDGPMIIVSAAGMLTGGRILHHLKARLPHRANAVLFVGYQAPGTKGRLLQNGIDRLSIHHEVVDVNAEVISLEGFSAHADAREIIEWMSALVRPPRGVYLNHGDGDALKALRYRIRQELGWEAVEIPGPGDEFELD